MRLIKLHSSVDYQPSARNHLVFLPEVDMPVEAIYPEPAKEPLYLHNVDLRESLLLLESILWLELYVHLIVLQLKPLKAPLLNGLGSDLVYSMTESFLWPYIRNRIDTITG